MSLFATSEPPGCAGSTVRVNQKPPAWGESYIAPPSVPPGCAPMRPRDASAGGDVTLDVDQLHAEPLRDAEDALVPVELAVDDAANAGVRDLLEAVPARARRHVDGGPVNHDPVLRGL